MSEKLADALYPDELVESGCAYDDDFFRPRTKEKQAFLAGLALAEQAIEIALSRSCGRVYDQNGDDYTGIDTIDFWREYQAELAKDKKS
jgi:hypothetical protein